MNTSQNFLTICFIVCNQEETTGENDEEQERSFPTDVSI